MTFQLISVIRPTSIIFRLRRCSNVQAVWLAVFVQSEHKQQAIWACVGNSHKTGGHVKINYPFSLNKKKKKNNPRKIIKEKKNTRAARRKNANHLRSRTRVLVVLIAGNQSYGLPRHVDAAEAQCDSRANSRFPTAWRRLDLARRWNAI